MGWLIRDRALRGYGRGEAILARTAPTSTIAMTPGTIFPTTSVPAPAPAPAPAPVPVERTIDRTVDRSIDRNMLVSSQPLTLAPILAEKAAMAVPTRTYGPIPVIAPELAPTAPALAPSLLTSRTFIAERTAAAAAPPPTAAPLPTPIEIAREIARTSAVIAATPASKLPSYDQPRGNPYRGGGGAVTAEASVASDGTFVPAGTPVKVGKKFPWWLLLLLGYGAYRYSKKKKG